MINHMDTNGYDSDHMTLRRRHKPDHSSDPMATESTES